MAEKSHTKTWQRVSVFIIAMLFIITSAALTIAVLFQGNGNNNSNQQASNTSSNTSNTSNTSSKLAGTKLKGFTPVSTVPSLEITDLSKGSGAAVKPGQTVTVNYTGAVAATGMIFQSSLDTGQPATFPLSSVIEGWQQGIPGMKVGGTRQLVIPANEAYGANPPAGSGIPANASLVFNVTLLKIDS